MSTTLLALLTLLGGGHELLLTVLLANELSTLKTGLVDGSASLSTETSIGHERTLLLLVLGVEELKEAVGTSDLIKEGGVTGVSESSLGISLLALIDVALTLESLLLTELLTGLSLVGLESLLLTIVVVLDLADSSVLLLLLALELGSLVTEAGQTLVGLILLSLDGIKLGLDLVVLLRHGLLLRVVHAVLDFLDLGAKVVDLLLRLLELAKVLSDLAQAGDVGEGLLLINELHGTGVDLLVEGSDLTVDILNTLVRNLALGGLLLSDSAADLLIETLDLVELGGTGVLASSLLLTDLVGLGNKFLSSLLGRAGLVLVLVGHSNFDLGLDGVLRKYVSV